MSGSLNIYPFEDTETTIRFVVQVFLFLVGLAMTNKLIIKPALRLQQERKKRTFGNQQVAQDKLKAAQILEQNYEEKFSQAVENIKEIHVNQLKESTQKASEIISDAQQKSGNYLLQIKENLEKERALASSQIHLHVNHLVQEINSKFGISS